MQEHDLGLRRLFSHREMAADLLTGFVDEPWVKDIDLETLEPVPGDFVSHTFSKRTNDVIWRVRLREDWLYIYLILEFQSSVNRFMAVRLWVYLGLLYQKLIASQQLTRGRRLPPAVPIVLYNGSGRWTAPGKLAELIAVGPEPLAQYQPRLKYLLIEEQAYSDERLAGMRNLVAALFRLENSRSLQHCRQVLTALKAWLSERNQRQLAQSFADWLRRIYLPRRLPDVELPHTETLEEVATMLDDQTIDWTREWKEKGLAEGRAEGRAEGLVEGKREGESEFLLRMVRKKFGTVDEAVHQRISEADCDQLLAWGERLLSANCIEEVFEDP